MVRSRVDTSCWPLNSNSAMCRSCSSSSCSGAKVTCPNAVAAARRTESASSSRRPRSPVRTRLSPRTARRPSASVAAQRTRSSRSTARSSSMRSTTSALPSSANLPSTSTAVCRTKPSASAVRAKSCGKATGSSLSATFSSARRAARRTPPSRSSRRPVRAKTDLALLRLETCPSDVQATRRTAESGSLSWAVTASTICSSPLLPT
mmetsp:Transcript_52818/g.123152  ORF Transcript_52818/g.123152 Transcript_52818/m.123152 type:complete len:206 (-) Transcript_52818:253-870(-)